MFKVRSDIAPDWEKPRKIWIDKCAEACDKHNYPSKILTDAMKIDNGMKFMILDELKQIRQLLEENKKD